ncbi:MAG: hypothetical protein RRB22_12350 [Gammaproteobacteria bacterium]|nr:hypothetical protein [Gammaproteobacteria bacterium]
MNYNAQFPPSFHFLQQEAYLLRSCLTTGLTELRSANVHNKGAFYSALFNLSVGVERLLKAIVIMEHMLKNSLSVPTKKQLKGYGHNITDLYDECVKISNTYSGNLPSRNSLDNINQELIGLLSDFAQTTRYHNLDALSAQQSGKDPLEHWGEIILLILGQDVPEKQRNKILGEAKLIADAISAISITIMHGLDKQPLSTEEALALPGLHDQAVKFAVYRIICILSPLRDLISTLSHEAYDLGLAEPPFPQMQEFLDWVWDDRQYVLRKKKWP